MNDLLPWLLATLVAVAAAVVWVRRAAAKREAQRERDEAARQADRQRRSAEDAARAQAQRVAAQHAERLASRRAEAAAAAEAALAEARRHTEQTEREAAERVASAQWRAAAAEEAARQAAEDAAKVAAREAAHEAEREAARQAAQQAAQRADLARERLEAERAADAAARATEHAARAAAARKSPEDTLVMVADDSKVVRVKTGRLLEQHRYRVCYASDGLEASAAIDRQLPDVIITDVEMPGMDGFELTTRVRSNPATARLPVIMITAADDKHADSARRAGVSVLLGKPYADEELIARLRAVLEAVPAEAASC